MQALIALQRDASDIEARTRALEISTQPLALQIAQARLSLSERKLEHARKLLAAIDARLNALRLSAAQAMLHDTDSDARLHDAPELQQLAEANEQLARQLVELTERLNALGLQRE